MDAVPATLAHVPATLTATAASTEPPCRSVLTRLAGLRVLVAVALLAPLAAFAAGQDDLSQATWFALLLLVPLATSAATLLGSARAWLPAQVAVDAMVVLAVVWSTGGLVSHFSPLLLLPVLAASVLGGRAWGLRLSAGIGVGVVLIAAAQYGWISLPTLVLRPLQRSPLPLAPRPGYTIALTVGGAVAVALLVGQLAESLRRAGADLARATTSLAGLTTLSQRVIDSMAGGLIVADAQGTVVLFNRTAEAITGTTAGHALGRPVGQVLPLPSIPPDAESMPVRLDFTLTRQDGAVIEIGATVAPLLAESGQRAGCLFTFQDLTLINQKEAARHREERLAAIGEMAAGIAHEIRNPLASMSGSIQLLRKELTLRDDHALLLDIVMRESQRLNEITKSFLAYAGPQQVTRARVDVSALAREVGALLTQQVRDAAPRVAIHVDAPHPVLHDVDEAQVRQVIWNLATNGVKAMRQGGTLDIVVAQVGPGPTPGLRLSVRDEGVGMAAADVERMFQPFQSGFRQGTGLGLAIVQRIVTDHGGRVAVTSTPGVGTEIVVTLPAPTAPALLVPEARSA
jgi:two-component system, NtrC family, sensor histidine kinase PilS